MAVRRPSGRQSGLTPLRKRIDALDDRLLALVNERARLAQSVAEAKRARGEDGFYRAEREAQVLRRVVTRNPGPLPDDVVARLFRELMSSCLALEATVQVAYLGPEGTYSESATRKQFGHGAELQPLVSIQEIFRAVEAGAAEFGVAPVENSTEGVIHHTLDMFVASPLRICGEVDLRIRHQLLGKGTTLKGRRKLVSHAQSLAQCRRWLDAHLPNLLCEAVASNAEAARLAASDKRLLAIAGQAAAERYGLETLAANIEDEPDNTTRFLVVGRHDPAPSGDDKTSLLVSGRNRAGMLSRLLEPFAKHRINLTRIESRPSREKLWDYVFFLDFDGHVASANVRRALGELERVASVVKWLGSYPKALS